MLTNQEDIFKYVLTPHWNVGNEEYTFYRKNGKIYYDALDLRNNVATKALVYSDSVRTLFSTIRNWETVRLNPFYEEGVTTVTAKIQELSKRFEQRPKKQAKKQVSLDDHLSQYIPRLLSAARIVYHDDMVTYVECRE